MPLFPLEADCGTLGRVPVLVCLPAAGLLQLAAISALGSAALALLNAEASNDVMVLVGAVGALQLLLRKCLKENEELEAAALVLLLLAAAVVVAVLLPKSVLLLTVRTEKELDTKRKVVSMGQKKVRNLNESPTFSCFGYF